MFLISQLSIDGLYIGYCFSCPFSLLIHFHVKHSVRNVQPEHCAICSARTTADGYRDMADVIGGNLYSPLKSDIDETSGIVAPGKATTKVRDASAY